jgi:hypothetical protein
VRLTYIDDAVLITTSDWWLDASSFFLDNLNIFIYNDDDLWDP